MSTQQTPQQRLKLSTLAVLLLVVYFLGVVTSSSVIAAFKWAAEQLGEVVDDPVAWKSGAALETGDPETMFSPSERERLKE